MRQLPVRGLVQQLAFQTELQDWNDSPNGIKAVVVTPMPQLASEASVARLADALTAHFGKAVKVIIEKGEVEDQQTPEPVECITMEDGSIMEIHQDAKGYVIRRLGKQLPTKFPALDHARMAVQLFKNRAQRHPEQQDIDQDYIEER